MSILLYALLLLAPAAQAATVELCATHDAYNKYFVGDVTRRSAVQKRVIALCVSRRGPQATCRKNLICNTVPNAKVSRVNKVVPFPPHLRGPSPQPRKPGRPSAPSSPSRPSEPTPPPRNTSPGRDCRANSDCYSGQYCAGGQCFEKSGGGAQSCQSNRDCYSNDFCVSGQCFPKTGSAGHSCKVNNDCYSYQFCVSGECFNK